MATTTSSDAIRPAASNPTTRATRASRRPARRRFIDKGLLIYLLPTLEQTTLYNTINQNLTILGAENQTVHTVSVSTFVCPDDPTAGYPRDVPANDLAPFGLPDPPSGRQRMVFSNYVGSAGPFPTLGLPLPLNHCQVTSQARAQNSGAFCDVSPLNAASISDGLSHTIFLAEKATITLQPLTAVTPLPFEQYGWYVAGNWGDTLFTCFYRPNAFRTTAPLGSPAFINSASSLHPGGLNVAMGDGSVHFVKETINCWPTDRLSGQPSGCAEAKRSDGRTSPPLAFGKRSPRATAASRSRSTISKLRCSAVLPDRHGKPAFLGDRGHNVAISQHSHSRLFKPPEPRNPPVSILGFTPQTD